MAHLHVLRVRVGDGVEVSHTHVHGVLERHLVPLQVGGGWGLEEMEKEHAMQIATCNGYKGRLIQ